MDHIGIGATQLNNLLSELNLPTIHHKTLKNRDREIGPAIETVANNSMNSALAEEIQQTIAM